METDPDKLQGSGRQVLSTKHALNTRFAGLDDVAGNEYPFSSPHTGGVNFAFCDGHVEFIDDLIDFNVYQAYSTRAGGELTHGK